jgi:hypothetical protein
MKRGEAQKAQDFQPSNERAPRRRNSVGPQPCPKAGRTRLSPKQVAERYGVGVGKVITWIRNGELRAMNIASRLDVRPRYSIAPADLEEFEKTRYNVTPILSPPPQWVSRSRGDRVIQFF